MINSMLKHWVLLNGKLNHGSVNPARAHRIDANSALQGQGINSYLGVIIRVYFSMEPHN